MKPALQDGYGVGRLSIAAIKRGWYGNRPYRTGVELQKCQGVNEVRLERTMTEKETLLEEIKSIVARIHPLRAIVFGSFAYGQPDEGSDIDLLVVLNKSGLSESYAEVLENKRELSRGLRAIRKRIPIDLLVYTKDEWEYIKRSGSSFYRHIEKYGVDLL